MMRVLLLIFLFSSALFAQTAPNVPAIEQIQLGNNRLCALFQTGDIACAGGNANSDLLMHKMELPAGKKAVKMAAGYYHLCAILNDGSIACWADRKILLGEPEGNTPVADPNKPNIVKIGALRAVSIQSSESLTCATFENGTATCWGYMGNRSVRPKPFVVVPTGLKFKQISPGTNHLCAILSDNRVYCWGPNGYGQLGTYSGINGNERFLFTANPSKPIDFGPGLRPLSVAAGFDYTCVILERTANPYATQVKCFGKNDSFTLGTGDARSTDIKALTKDLKPVELPAGYYPDRLLAGMERVCALNLAGIMLCWGSNVGFISSLESDRRIGDQPSDLGEAMVPFNWGPLVRANSAAISSAHTCILANKTSVYCWGSGSGALRQHVLELSGNQIGQFTELLKPVDFTSAFEAATVRK